LPKGKHVEIALTYIYGVGLTSSKAILSKLKIERTLKIETISEDDLDKIRAEVKEYIVE
jgi:small subunit ribosomal protein S13